MQKTPLNPYQILDSAQDRCTDWDGVIILDAAMYRLAGITDDLSMVHEILVLQHMELHAS